MTAKELVAELDAAGWPEEYAVTPTDFWEFARITQAKIEYEGDQRGPLVIKIWKDIGGAPSADAPMTRLLDTKTSTAGHTE